MNVIEKNTTGEKIQYKTSGTKITFGNVLTLDLSAYERDDPVHLDISRDAYGMLTMGIARRYVAQIDIPARQYNIVNTGEVDPETGSAIQDRVAVPFDMGNVSLTLWAVEG